MSSSLSLVSLSSVLVVMVSPGSSVSFPSGKVEFLVRKTGWLMEYKASFV